MIPRMDGRGWWAVGIGLLGGGFGCVGAAPAASSVVSGPPPASAASIRSYAPGIGSADVEPVVRGFVVGAAGLLGEATIEAGRCRRFELGLPRGVEDADLVAYDREGRRLAHDESDARYASVVVCARSELAVRLRVTAARGAGEVELSSRIVDAEALRRSGLPDTAISRGNSTPGDALRDRAIEELAPIGYRLDAGPLRLSLDAGVPMRIGLAPRTGECLQVRVRSHDGAVRLTIATQDGTVLAEDSGADRDLAVANCSVDGAAIVATLTSERSTEAYVVVSRGIAREVGGASVSIGSAR